MPKTLTGSDNFLNTITNFPLGTEAKSLSFIESAIQKVLNNTIHLKAVSDTAVKTAGDFTMAGHLTIPAPAANMHAATKKYVDDLLVPTSGGDYDNGWRLDPRDGWIKMWVTTDLGDNPGTSTVTVNYPFALTTVAPICMPVIHLKGGTVADTYPSLKSVGNASCQVYIDEITALTQDQKLRVLIEGWKA